MRYIIKILILIIVIFNITPVFSQNQNSIKLSIGDLFVRNINLNYERAIRENESFSFTAGFILPGKVPIGGAILENKTSTVVEKTMSTKFSGFSVRPEYRFYAGNGNNALTGFYFAPYLKYSNYKVETSQIYNDAEIPLEGKISSFGGGAQLGYQWMVSDRIIIDWYFLGLGLNRHAFSLQYSNLSDENLAEITEYIEEIPIIGSKIKTEEENNEVKARVSALIPGFRTGLSVGFTF